ncbi:MAG: DoxX family protein [Chloroflexi bacterium HGW-Chloroflexi-5]|jgi:uncharacterized membrane protein YphA (DoxX/SURF4 family)|nr:MAG: DoxX family protein [Chloroflexi bacterium HGW-Chloroflexi-5]
MNIVLWIIQGLLLLMYLIAGAMKAFNTKKARESMNWAQERPSGFVRFVGTSEMLGALGLVLPMLTGILPWLTPLAAIGLTLIQLLAILTVHIPKREYKILPMNLILLLLALFVAVGRWGLLSV